MKQREKLVQILTKLYNTKAEICRNIYSKEIVNNGIMTWTDLNFFVSSPDNLESANDSALYHLYDAVYKSGGFKIPPASDFFTDIEIGIAKESIVKRTKEALPLKLPILAKLTDNDNYLSVISIQEIRNLKQHGIIKWKEGMQREVIMTKLADDSFISHIAYDDNRAREIGKSMLDNSFFPNALRWHIVPTDCTYDITSDSVILKSGYIAEIDGQHRDKGSEYALMENPDIIMNMPIILTIGSRATAQQIINQDEKRAPINKNVLAQYRNTSGNNILKSIIGSGSLDSVFRFCDTEQGIRVGAGFILKSEFASCIEKYYNARSAREIERTAAWITEFLNAAAENRYSEFENYKKSKTAITKSEGIAYLIYLSSALRDKPDWEKSLKAVLDKTDFGDSKFRISKPELIAKGAGLNV